MLWTPAQPEMPHLHCLYGVHLGTFALAAVSDVPEYVSSLPSLLVLGRSGVQSYVFSHRTAHRVLFRPLDTHVGPESFAVDLARSFPHPSITGLSPEQWEAGLAHALECFAARTAEDAAQAAGVPQTHHVLLDVFTTDGQRVERRLIGSFRTRLAAAYQLRQHQGWTRHLWWYHNAQNAYRESAFSVHVDVATALDVRDRPHLRVETSFPFSRGRKRPFTRLWSWHLSRRIPLVPVMTSTDGVLPTDRDERWNYRPGSPRLLRETGSGLFGSYPRFEGDDEPEHRDELHT